MKNKFLTASNILDSLLNLSIKREDLYKLKMIQSDIVVKRESVDSYLKFLKNLKLEFPENKSELEKIINIVGDIQSKKSLDFKDESLVLGFFINKNTDFNYKGFKKSKIVKHRLICLCFLFGRFHDFHSLLLRCCYPPSSLSLHSESPKREKKSKSNN